MTFVPVVFERSELLSWYICELSDLIKYSLWYYMYLNLRVVAQVT